MTFKTRQIVSFNIPVEALTTNPLEEPTTSLGRGADVGIWSPSTKKFYKAEYFKRAWKIDDGLRRRLFAAFAPSPNTPPLDDNAAQTIMLQAQEDTAWLQFEGESLQAFFTEKLQSVRPSRVGEDGFVVTIGPHGGSPIGTLQNSSKIDPIPNYYELRQFVIFVPHEVGVELCKRYHGTDEPNSLSTQTQNTLFFEKH